jgi:uncharacterized protein (DUF2237 family)
MLRATRTVAAAVALALGAHAQQPGCDAQGRQQIAMVNYFSNGDCTAPGGDLGHRTIVKCVSRHFVAAALGGARNYDTARPRMRDTARPHTRYPHRQCKAAIVTSTRTPPTMTL